MVDQPTEEDLLNLQPVDAEGRRRRADQDREGITFKDAAMTVAEMTPIIGDAMAAKEVYDELMKEDPNYGLIAALGGAALIGAIPGIGDAAAAGIRKAADTLKRVEIDPDALGMMGGNIRLKPKPKEEDYLTLDNPNYKELRGQVDETTDIKAAESLLDLTEEDIAKVRKGQSKNRKQEEAGKRPFAEEAQALEKNEITGKEFREKAFADVEKFTELEELPTFTEIVFALDKNKREKGIIGLEKSMAQGAKKIAAGDKVMARLDIPAYNNYDVYVPQISFRKEGVKGAESVFSRTMVIEDVKFPTPQKPSFDIARGKENKFPHATINGKVASNPASKKMYTDQEAHDLAKSVFDDPDFVHVGYNPDRGGFFYNRETGMPVFDSPLVVQIGKQIFAKRSGETSAERIAKMRKMDLRKTSPDIKKPTLFSEGGMALEEQMTMNFGDDVPDNTIGVDPVSGNEIPLGSSAENVRDDIPANLSEGEIVIPADVANYWGVKFFEDLRAQAKRGYAEMAEDGRIGGQPIPTESMDLGGLDIVIGDLEVVDDMGEPEEAFLGKFFAGIREANQKQAKKNADSARQQVRDRFSAAQQRGSVNKVKASKPEKKFKNNFEKIMYQLFGDDDDDKPTPPPSKKKDKPKIDFGFGGNPMERAARKYGTEPTETKNEPLRNKPKPKYTPPDATKRGYEPETTGQTFAEYLNFGGNYDEGGFATSMPAKTGQLLPDDYDPSVDSVGGGAVGGEMEMREYANAAGHVIMIPFMDGVPMAVIPEGYYPVGSTPQVVATGTGGGGGSSDDDGPEPPEPFNYKELSIDELTGEVQNLQQAPTFLGTNLFTGIIAVAQKRHKNKTIKEIERRLENSDLAIYEREHLENLLEVAKAPTKKGAIGKLVDKITGEETEDPDLPNLTGPTYDELPDQYGITEPYEPETSAEPSPSSNVPDFTNKELTEARQASADAAARAFGTPSKTVEPYGQEEFIKTAIQDPTSMLPPTTEDKDDDAPDTGGYDPVGTGSVDDPSTRRRSGGGGRNKGGMMQKKKKKKSK